MELKTIINGALTSFDKAGYKSTKGSAIDNVPLLEYHLSLGESHSAILYFLFRKESSRGLLLLGPYNNEKKFVKSLDALTRRNRAWDYQIEAGNFVVLRYDLPYIRGDSSFGANAMLDEMNNPRFLVSLSTLYPYIERSDPSSFYRTADHYFYGVWQESESRGSPVQARSSVPENEGMGLANGDKVYIVYGSLLLIAGIVLSVLASTMKTSVIAELIMWWLGYAFIIAFASILPYFAGDKELPITGGWRFLMFLFFALISGGLLFLYLSLWPMGKLAGDDSYWIVFAGMSMSTPITYFLMYLIRMKKSWSRLTYLLLLPLVMFVWPALYIGWIIFVIVVFFGGFFYGIANGPDTVELTEDEYGEYRDSNGVQYDKNSDGTVSKHDSW